MVETTYSKVLTAIAGFPFDDYADVNLPVEDEYEVGQLTEVVMDLAAAIANAVDPA